MIEHWTDRAVCRGDLTDLWFDGDGADDTVEDPDAIADAAISHCMVCPVREECARTAAAYAEEHGVWGGYRMWVPEERQHVLDTYEPLPIEQHDPRTRS